MKYKKEVNDFEKALGLSREQVARIKNAISKAYDQNWHELGPNIDQINASIAPSIQSQEEAFYAATIVVTDVLSVVKMFK